MNKNVLPGWAMNLHPEEFITMNNQVPNAKRLKAENNLLKTLPLAEAKTQRATFQLNLPKLHHALSTIVDLGAKYVRTDFAWDFLQFQIKDGTFWNDTALAQFQEFLKQLQQYHLEPICILFRPPKWMDCYLATSDYWQLYAEYCAKIVNTMGQTITYYQIWNEPNNHIADPKAHSAEGLDFYSQLIASGQLTIKNINPKAIAMINIMVNNDDNWLAHLSHYIQFIQRCDKDNIVQIYGIDHYPATWTKPVYWLDWSPVDSAVQLLAELGLKNKSTAIIETGYSTIGNDLIWIGSHTEDDQENWIVNSLNTLHNVTYAHNTENRDKIAFFNWYECYDMTKEEKPMEITVTPPILQWIPIIGGIEESVRNIEYHFGIHGSHTSRKYSYDSLKRTINTNSRNLATAIGPDSSTMFCRGTDGFLRGYNFATGEWEAPLKGTGRMTGDVVAIYNTHRQHPDVFFRGPDGFLYYYFAQKWQGCGVFSDKSWAKSGQLKGTLSVVRDEKNQHPEVFLKGDDGGLYRYYATNAYTDKAAWVCEKPSDPFGSRVKGSLAAIYNPEQNRQHTEVFYKGETGNLHYLYHQDGKWVWGGEWFFMAGEVMGDVAAVYNTGQARPEVFFVGHRHGGLEHYFMQSGMWNENLTISKLQLSIPVLGQMAAVYCPGEPFASVFYKGGDGYLHRFFFDNQQWTEDTQSFRQGGVVMGGVSAYVRNENGVHYLHVVYRDENNQAHWFRLENNVWIKKVTVDIP